MFSLNSGRVLFPLAIFLSTLVFLSSATTSRLPGSYRGPRTPSEFRHKHPYVHRPPNNRRKVYIRASKDETDDISQDFYNGLKKANHGGTLVLPAGKTFVIGKKLDLTFLKDVEVALDGEILVSLSLVYLNLELAPLYKARATIRQSHGILTMKTDE
jgi:galacturan 1,4-alpha-galacturonidase